MKANHIFVIEHKSARGSVWKIFEADLPYLYATRKAARYNASQAGEQYRVVKYVPEVAK